MSSSLNVRIVLSSIEPSIWRELLLPGRITLSELHLVIQAAFGWENRHLYMFLHGETKYQLPDPLEGEAGRRSPETTRLESLDLSDGTDFRYIYDFGDWWEHTIETSVVGPGEDTEPLRPVLTGGDCPAPPEDCGGPPGFELLREALSNPGYSQHGEMKAWAKRGCLKDFSLEEAAARVSRAR